MRIGELARRLDVNPRTLRFYESIGLLPEPARTSNGYRDYGGQDLERVRFVKSAQRLGLSLEDIREILAFKDRGEVPCNYVLEVIDRETDALDERIAELERLREELRRLRARARRLPPKEPSAKACICHILESDVTR